MNKNIILLILLVFVLASGCSDSSSSDNSVMIFEVTTIRNIPIDEYASNHEGTHYPIRITLIDYEPESEFTGTVITSKIGLSSITGGCGGGSCFIWVDLDSTFFPVEFLLFIDLIIDNSQMRGRYILRGSTISSTSLAFTASRKE